MNTYKVKFAIKAGSRTMETQITAKSPADVKKMIKAQYGDKATIYGCQKQ